MSCDLDNFIYRNKLFSKVFVDLITQRLTRTLPIIFILAALYGVSFPLIAIKIESSVASARLIGLIAAMPALGWIIGSVALPSLLRRFSIKSVMTGFLLLACVAWLWSGRIDDASHWIPMRLVFGGAIGSFFRSFEYWLTTSAKADRRGRTFGIYAAVFVGGIIIGALVQPTMGTGIFAQTFVGAGLLCVAFIFALTSTIEVQRPQFVFRPSDLLRFGKVAPMAMFAAMVFAFYEEIPASFLPIYALKLGYCEAFAAVIVAASVLGSFTGAIPMGWLSDKFGRSTILVTGAGAGVLGALIIPQFAGSQISLLSGVFIWAILVEGIYCVSLAMIADQFTDEDLLHVNVSYGLYYAAGALLGPLIVGESMYLFGPNGLFSAAGVVFAALFIASVWNGLTNGRR